MATVDIVIVLLVLAGAVFGWKKGFSVTASYFAGSFLGTWAASNYYEMPGKFVHILAKHPAGGYLTVFFAVFFAVVLIGIILNKIFKIIFLGWVDTIAGAVVGIVVSLTIAAALLLPCRAAKIKVVRKYIDNSVVARSVVLAAKKSIKLLPPSKPKFFDIDFEENIKPILKQLKKI